MNQLYARICIPAVLSVGTSSVSNGLLPGSTKQFLPRAPKIETNVIGGKGPASEREIKNRWCKAINNRLALDCALTDKAKYEKKSINTSVVRKTWSKVLKDEDRLPRDWFREHGVLVGVG
ncbi:hypothetical protein B0H11DRAFT_1905910 [Mycena galericulata]|nr:hypothetical protein B0H11DRAFT_1905910 [Mycena galericulata]